MPDRVQGQDIPMLSLVRQQEGIRAEIEGAVLGAIAEAEYISRDRITPFEEKLALYCDRPYAVGVASGSAALHIALLALDIGPGDEVITVPNSFFATTEAILHVGAKPVFVDVDPATHTISLDALSATLTDRVRAVAPVHLYGNVADVDGIRRILAGHGRSDVVILEDCAHAIGARRDGRKVPLGDVGAFSFNPGKNLGAISDAGAVVTSLPEVAEVSRMLRDHGRVEKNTHRRLGFNSRLGHINDRVLAVKLRYLDRWNEERRSIARRYNTLLGDLSNLSPVAEQDGVVSSYHQYVIRTRQRDGLRKHLQERGIATAIHYPRLISEQEALTVLGYSPRGTPTALDLSRHVLSLPCYPELTENEVVRIIHEISLFFRRKMT